MSPYTEKIGTLLYMGHLSGERNQMLFSTWPQKGPLYRFEHHHVPYLGFDRPGYHCTILLMHDEDEVRKLQKRDEDDRLKDIGSPWSADEIAQIRRNLGYE